MSDPRRLLEDPSALSGPERRALAAAQNDEPPARLREGVWAALSAALPPVAGPIASGSAASGAVAGSGAAGGIVAGGGAVATIVKALAVGVAIGGLSIGGRTLWTSSSQPSARVPMAVVPTAAAPPAMTARESAPPREAEPALVVVPATDPAPARPANQGVAGPGGGPKALDTPSRAPALEPRAQGNEPIEEASQAPAAGETMSMPAAPSRAVAAARGSTSDARDESHLVGVARDELRSGRATEALRLLQQAQARFPGGILTQEREALSIEALVQSGQRSVAADRARAFLREHPESPHAGRVRAIVDSP
jgi:hypothetical protein